MLSRAVSALTRRMADLLNVERASFFLVDHPGNSLVLAVSEDAGQHGEPLRIPLTTGIAGAAVSSGRALRVADAYAHPSFNPSLDRATGFTTRSVLAVPVRNGKGEIFAVAQLLNRRDGRPFEVRDEERLGEFLASLGVILETLQLLSLPRSAPGFSDGGGP
jgi:adenylate cyclase